MPSTASWTAASCCPLQRWEEMSCCAPSLASSERCSARERNKRSNCWSLKALKKKVRISSWTSDLSKRNFNFCYITLLFSITQSLSSHLWKSQMTLWSAPDAPSVGSLETCSDVTQSTSPTLRTRWTVSAWLLLFLSTLLRCLRP